jgi:polyether ionophore transport system permease protein
MSTRYAALLALRGPRSAGEFTGTGALIRLILRRDWIKLLIWVALVSLVPIGIASSFAELYPTTEALNAYADEVMRTPATVGMLGLVFSRSLGGLVAWRSGLNGAILIAPVALLFVVRYTRTEEETGRRELIGSTVVGRFAPLTAALVVVFAASLIIAGIISSGLIGLGLPVAGSMALGLSAASIGWMFAAVASVTAQLTESSGAARGFALSVFGLSYLVRAVGDAGGEQGKQFWLSWLSPLGWVRLTRAFAGEQWWVLGLSLCFVSVFCVVAYGLLARRDLGAGLLPASSGAANTSPRLDSPLALAWRLHRGAFFAWSGGAVVFGSLLGSTGYTFSTFVDVPQLQDWVLRMGAESAGDAFLFILMYVLGQVASAYAISAALRMRSEEVEQRADMVLATAVSRLRWAASHLFFAIIGPTVVLTVLGFFIGLGFGSAAGDIPHELPRLFIRTLETLPAIWVMVGIATLLFGFLPRLAVAGTWGLLALFFALELGWELQQISQAVFNISPFAYVHWSLPLAVRPLIGLTLVAMALISVGLFRFQRRDVS